MSASQHTTNYSSTKEIKNTFLPAKPVVSNISEVPDNKFNKKVYISSAREDGCSLDPMKGDTDYLDTILTGIRKQLGIENVIHIEEKIRQNTNKNNIHTKVTGNDVVKILSKCQPGVFHIMLNLPFTGGAYNPEQLSFLKRKGYKIIISCIEFKKYLGRDEESQIRSIDILRCADQIIFLDQPDKKAVELYVSKLGIGVEKGQHQFLKNIQKSVIIPVPATVPITYQEWIKRPPNIISFGCIRPRKGLSYLVKLAEFFKAADEKESKKRHVMLVGSMESSAYDLDGIEGFSELIKRIFPKHIEEIDQLATLWTSFGEDKIKKTEIIEKIKNRINEWQNNFQDIDLPIRFYFDKKPDEIPDLFAQARYSFLPAYRGFTLRNTSISASLVNGCITYSHATDIFPKNLFKHYTRSPVILIPEIASDFHNNKDYDTLKYADTNGLAYVQQVFDDIQKREKNTDFTLSITLPSLRQFVSETIALDKIAKDIINVYKKSYKPSSIPCFSFFSERPKFSVALIAVGVGAAVAAYIKWRMK